MDLLKAHKKFRFVMHPRRCDEESIRRTQEEKLRRLLRHAYDRVPYYKQIFDEAGVSPGSITSIDDLQRVPITAKSDLGLYPTESMIDRRVRVDDLSSETSSGSTGTPFTIYYDRELRTIRSLIFLRGLLATGYRLGDKLILVTSPKARRWSSRLLRWTYASVQAPPAELLEILLEVAPRFMYGCLTSLRLLADEILEKRITIPPLRGLITTSETLDTSLRRMLEGVFHCDVFDFYGLSEAGLVGWECLAHNGYHTPDDAIIVEPVELAQQSEYRRLVVTHLESTAMPLIRYDTGDLAVFDDDHSCRRCGALRRLRRIEGRAVDCIRLPHGRLVSPYALTSSIEQVPGVARYQVVQEKPDSLRVRVQTTGADSFDADAVRTAVSAAIDSELSIEIESAREPLSLPGGKFRPVECRL